MQLQKLKTENLRRGSFRSVIVVHGVSAESKTRNGVRNQKENQRVGGNSGMEETDEEDEDRERERRMRNEEGRKF